MTQETFLRTFSANTTVQEGDWGMWVYSIAQNVWKNTLRDRSRMKREATEVSLDRESQEPQVPATSSESDPLGTLLQEESLNKLRSALLVLPPKMRRCVLLRVHHGLKYREIAALLGISIDTVKAHLHQAKHHLKHELGEAFELES